MKNIFYGKFATLPHFFHSFAAIFSPLYTEEMKKFLTGLRRTTERPSQRKASYSKTCNHILMLFLIPHLRNKLYSHQTNLFFRIIGA